MLRVYNYEGRTNYGWDQARDVGVIEQSLKSNRLPLLGPIVRGDIGGFYLGPLYHYMVQPIYALTSHNPLSLVWFSILADVAVALGLAVWISPLAGVIWATSSLLINSALTPWNVSLVHPWMFAILFLSTRLLRRPSPLLNHIFLLILATSTSIHLTLLPVAGVLLLYVAVPIWRATRHLYHWLLYILALFLPQLPLILSDLKTSGSNLRAFKDYLFIKSGEVPVSLLYQNSTCSSDYCYPYPFPPSVS
ncbi:MAG: hypothetical protein UX62_C0026G0007 [Microgenomates group bacterium GW2011_GWA2_46_7]|nr:MAG: hypothetical protein UX62_C0026G0007 [Microgenomates group bacterium GW2011_GWA2_46_7]